MITTKRTGKERIGMTRWVIILAGSLTFLALLCIPKIYAEQPIPQIVLEPGSKLWLIGDSTLHAYSATATDLRLAMEIKPVADLFEEIRAGGIKGLDVRVPVKGLKSGKSQLDRNMHRALKVNEHPEIIFHLLSYEVLASTSAASFSLLAKGDLSIAGQTNAIDLRANVTAGEHTRIEGSKNLLMTDYGVKPPSFLGAIKTHNRVIINFDLFLSQKPTN